MKITQVSVFLENRPGRLLFLLQLLADAEVNLIAHNIVDASDFGIIHIIVDDPEKAVEAVRDAGLTCSTTPVLQVTVEDEPGAFAERVLAPLATSDVNIEYSYTYSSPCAGEAVIILKLDDIEAGAKALAAG
jgi:hypothetical protein